MENKAGFSLIEVLIGGTITALLGVVLYSFFATSLSQLTQNAGRNRLIEASDFIHNNFRHLATASTRVVNAMEYDSIYSNKAILTADTLNTIHPDRVIFWTQGAPGGVWKGLAVQNQWLYEKSGSQPSDTAGAWTPYMIGTDSLHFSAGSRFTLFPGRAVLRIDSGYVRLSSRMDDSLFFPGLLIKCKYGTL